MAYNHGREDRKWRIWKEAEEKILRECGADEVVIGQIRTDDRANFNFFKDYRVRDIFSHSILHGRIIAYGQLYRRKNKGAI